MTDQSGQDLFNKPQATPESNQPSASSLFADRLKTIVNEEGKPKYDSVEKALEALQHSQQYIPQLKSKVDDYEARLAQLQAELDKRQSVEDVVSRLTARQDQPKDTSATPAQVAGLDEKAAAELFDKMLTQRQQVSQRDANKRKVEETLVKLYGDKASEVLAEKANALGVSLQDFGEMASDKPGVILALFNSQPAPKGNPVNTSVNLPGRYQQQETQLERPTKSLLAGATTKDQAEYLRKVRENVYKRHGVQP